MQLIEAMFPEDGEVTTIDVSRDYDVGDEEEEYTRKIAIVMTDDKYDATQNINSDMSDADYETLVTDSYDELLKFIFDFVY